MLIIQYLKVFFCNIVIFTMLQACSSYTVKDNMPAKIISYHKRSVHKCSSNHNIVLVGGCFDLLHYGHLQFLRKARAQGDYLIVALEPDETILNYKKRHPIHNQRQRAENLSSLRFVDEVVVLPVLKGFDDYNQLVQDICPAVIAVTKNDPQIVNKRRQAQVVGAKVIEVIDALASQTGNAVLSNTAILNKLLD